MSEIRLTYYQEEGLIQYQRGDLVISTLLCGYDDLIRLVAFDNGLLTVLMQKNGEHVEEYVDFEYALDMLGLSDQASEYFDGITLSDIELV